ncbi:MAG: hypothetical protein HDS56_02060 [Barnesiella sp.]|nr:hypothetical protein [Barnesiella sp.]
MKPSFKNIFVDYVINTVNKFMENNQCIDENGKTKNIKFGEDLKTKCSSLDIVASQIEIFVNDAIQEVSKHKKITINEAYEEFIEVYLK